MFSEHYGQSTEQDNPNEGSRLFTLILGGQTEQELNPLTTEKVVVRVAAAFAGRSAGVDPQRPTGKLCPPKVTVVAGLDN